MKLLTLFLDTIAKRYYPVGIHESDETYHLTKQHQNYLVLHSKFDELAGHMNWTTKNLSGLFPGCQMILNGSTSHYPVYEIEFFLGKRMAERKYLTIYVSFMVPYYHAVLLCYNQESGGLVALDNKKIPKENEIAFIFQKYLGYSVFPKTILNQPIPGLKVMENFSYMNAFFTDYYRITHNT